MDAIITWLFAGRNISTHLIITAYEVKFHMLLCKLRLFTPCSVMVRVEGAMATSTNIHFSAGIRLYKLSIALFSISVPRSKQFEIQKDLPVHIL